MKLRQYLSPEMVIAMCCLTGLLLAIGWSRMRTAEELENVKISQERVDTVAAALSRLSRTSPTLQSMIQQGTLKPEMLKDAWGRELQFDRSEGVVYSLGLDGVKGGSGFAADLTARVKQ